MSRDGPKMSHFVNNANYSQVQISTHPKPWKSPSGIKFWIFWIEVCELRWSFPCVISCRCIHNYAFRRWFPQSFISLYPCAWDVAEREIIFRQMACCLAWKQDLGWNANFLIRLLLLFTNKRRWFSSQIRPQNAPRPMPSLRKTKCSIVCIKILWMAKCQNSWVENVYFYSQIAAVSWWKITVKLSKYGALIAIFFLAVTSIQGKADVGKLLDLNANLYSVFHFIFSSLRRNSCNALILPA